MRLTKVEKDFVATARVARLATVGADGVPHNVPVCPLLHKGNLYVGTATDAKKVRNIKSNPKVALVFDDYSEAWQRLRGIMIQCRARVLDSRKFREVRKKFYAKYPQYESSSPLTEGDSAILEVSPRKKLTWGL